MWIAVEQIGIQLRSSLELGIHIPLFELHIILFVNNADQPFDFVKRIKQIRQLLFGNSPNGAVFQELDIFDGGLSGNIAMERRNEIVFKTKPMGNFFIVEFVKPAECAFFKEIKMLTGASFFEQEIVFGKVMAFSLFANASSDCSLSGW